MTLSTGELMPGIGFIGLWENQQQVAATGKKIMELVHSGRDPQQTLEELWLPHDNVWERW